MDELNVKMTALADAIREKTGQTGKLSLDAMTTAIESISTATGGGFETCNVSILLGDFAPRNNYMVSYVDESQAFRTQRVYSGDVIQVVKNTAIIVWHDDMSGVYPEAGLDSLLTTWDNSSFNVPVDSDFTNAKILLVTNNGDLIFDM